MKEKKSTKYFANLEKRNFDAKHISELITKENGQSVSDPKEILKQAQARSRLLRQSIFFN